MSLRNRVASALHGYTTTEVLGCEVCVRIDGVLALLAEELVHMGDTQAAALDCGCGCPDEAYDRAFSYRPQEPS